MTVKSVKTLILCIAALLFLVLWPPCFLLADAATEQATADYETAGTMDGEETKSGYGNSSRLGGPKSVGAQLRTDDKLKKPLFSINGLQRFLKPYYGFKRWVSEKIDLQFGGDYNVLLQDASRSMGENTAVGSVFRFFGQWDLLGRDSKNTGTLVYKVESRHRLGTEIAPQQLAGEIGYAGLTDLTFSNAGWALTNFFWQQELLDGRLGFVVGQVDVTDYIDDYGMVSPWTGFINLAFSTDPTIPAPNQGLGAYALLTFTNKVYVLTGLADANGDPTDPLEGFQTFFGDHEFFKHMEVGWFSSLKNRFDNNIHLTGWQADARNGQGITSGLGVAFSFNHLVADQWLPFLRAGYSDGGAGTPLDRSVSIGIGRYIRHKSDLLGLGFNWGRPSEETFGSGLSNQYTVELFYRLHLLPHLTITPDLQLVVNPALNPEEDQIWVFGLRTRLDF